jgi:predicted dithiol-disulfide oxidoreductase (DUF899 family)
MTDHRVVSREEWLVARKALLAKEKELTHRQDALSAQRRELPWVKLEKEYVFESSCGRVSLADLFDGRSQLVVYHFMLGPDWKEGCPSCSYLMDHVNGALPHLNARDVTLALVSRAPLATLQAFERRMGWGFNWVSSLNSDFNRDFGVHYTPEQLASGRKQYNYDSITAYGEESHGLSVFARDARGELFHTYSTYGRGCEPLVGTYAILDLVPKGRDEDGLTFPMAWVRHHDKYEPNANARHACCHAQESHA